jgi:MinD superfamily P-loop ATPase
MIIAVASGKGGTGKTTVAVNLALALGNVQFLDCDVEEPNAHIFLKPQIDHEQKATIPVPDVDETKCTWCGTCREVCLYHAIAVIPQSGDKKGKVLIFPELCHGCGACTLLCPEKAMKEIKREIGVIEIGTKNTIRFVHGRLNIGEAMSPPLIRQVKAHIDPEATVIIDAPPGTSCPVITTVKGSDVCVLVTEPTPFGLNDLILAVEVLRVLQIPFGVVINRADIGDGMVEEYCAKENIAILMKIPFKKEIAVSYSVGIPIIEQDSSYREKFIDLYKNICRIKK